RVCSDAIFVLVPLSGGLRGRYQHRRDVRDGRQRGPSVYNGHCGRDDCLSYCVVTVPPRPVPAGAAVAAAGRALAMRSFIVEARAPAFPPSLFFSNSLWLIACI